MSIKKKLLLLILSLTALALTVLAGCMGELGAEDFLNGKDALNQYVTYYANGGLFDGMEGKKVKTIHYVADSYVIDDFEEVTNISITRSGFTFDGWCKVELNNGEPVLDEEGNPVVSSESVDFTKKIQANEKWYIAATWVPDIRLEIKLVTSDGNAMTAADGTSYNNGSIIATRSFKNGVAIMDMTTPLKSSDYTFTQFFYDEACTDRVLSNIPQPDDGATANPVIYAQYLKGDWEVVKTVANVRSMLLNPNGKNFWLCSMTEQKVFDCSSITTLSMRTGEFAAHIEGNGFTLKGLTVKSTLQQAGSTYSLFGQFTQNTYIKDLTFEDLTVNATTSRSCSIYLAVGSATGATLDNFNIKNASLNITSGVPITNIPEADGVHHTENWIFGGNLTDEAFLQANTGVTLDGATLTIGGKTYSY